MGTEASEGHEDEGLAQQQCRGGPAPQGEPEEQEAIDVACFVDTNTSFRTHHNMSMYHARLHHI